MDLSLGIYKILEYALSLNNAEVVKDSESFYEIDDKLAHIFYIVPKNEVNILNEIESKKDIEPTICIISKTIRNIPLIEPFKKLRETCQYSYHGEIKDISIDIEINDMTMDDLEYFRNHYYRNGNDEEYLVNAIKRGMLKAVKDNRIVGFIGEHPEHALGLLYIDEAYRRQGIGRALETAMINKVLKENRVPLDHVILDNEKSIQLQKSFNGMELDDGYIYWLF